LNKEKLENDIIAELREINIANAALSAPVYSHKEILELRGITKLRQLGELLRVKYYGKRPRQELISEIVDAMKHPAILRLFLNKLVKMEWDFFLNATAQKEIQADCLFIDFYISAQHMGILQSFYHDNQLSFVVPNEIKTTFKQLEESGYVAEKDFRDNLTGFAIAAINLYGVISQDDFAALYNSRNERQTNIDEMFSILVEQVYAEIGFCFWDEYIVDDAFEEDDFIGVKRLLAERKGKPRYSPSYEELIRYTDWDYYEFTLQLEALQRHLTKFISDPDEVLNLLDMIHDCCIEEANPQTYFDLLASADVTFDDTKQVNEMIQLIVDVQNNTRLWCNNGYTSNELVKLFGKSKILPFPSNRFAVAVKVGRNDPCPCGSGKKFKNCCDK